jgi:hypothetical protein
MPLLPIRSTCPAHRILPDLIILIILCEEYCFSVCSFLQPPLSSSLCSSNIFFSRFYSKLSLWHIRQAHFHERFPRVSEPLIWMELFTHSHTADQWFAKTRHKNGVS